jgi:hypothetical protein
MNGKWASMVLVVTLTVVLTGNPGCLRKTETASPPPVAPETAPTPETASADGGDVSTAALSPEEMARQMAELEAALARRRPATSPDRPATRPGPESAAPAAHSEQDPVREAGEVSLTSVRPVAAAGTPGATAPATAETSTTPVAAPPAEAVTLQTLIDRYQQLSDRRPGDVEVARTLRLLHFAAGQDDKSLEAIAGLPPSEQKLWRDLMWTLVVARDRTPGTNRSTHAGEVLDAIDRVRTELLAEAPLALGEVRFCDEVQRFGVYTPTTVSRFLPGQKLLLYTEVRNFTSRREGDGLYHVRLAQRLSLENEQGTVVWRHSFESIDDTCRSPRQDFFLGTTLPLPATLAAGRYALKVAVEDSATTRSAGARLELEIAAPR